MTPSNVFGLTSSEIWLSVLNLVLGFLIGILVGRKTVKQPSPPDAGETTMHKHSAVGSSH